MTQFTRKLIKIGNSLAVTIPKELVEMYKLFENDIVDFDLIKNNRDGK